MAFNTRWDYSISTYDYYIKPYPSYVSPGADTANIIYDTFSYYSRSDQRDVYYWNSWIKNRVQESLNLAVKYCAYALNYIADAWAEGDNPKFCEECSGQEKNPYPEDRPGRWSKIATALSILIVLGVANSLIGPILQIISQGIMTH